MNSSSSQVTAGWPVTFGSGALLLPPVARIDVSHTEMPPLRTVLPPLLADIPSPRTQGMEMKVPSLVIDLAPGNGYSNPIISSNNIESIDKATTLASLGIFGVSFDVVEQVVREIQRSLDGTFQIFETLDPVAKKEGLGTFCKRRLQAAMGNGRLEEICSKFGVNLSSERQVKATVAHHDLEPKVHTHSRVCDDEGKMKTREQNAAKNQQFSASTEPKHDATGKKSSSSNNGVNFEKESQESEKSVKEHLTVDKMREILKISDQYTTADNNRAELLFFGSSNKGARCNTSKKIDGKQYRCQGFFTEWTNCHFKVRNPPRKKEETKLIESIDNSTVDEEVRKEHQEIRVPEGYLLLYHRNSLLERGNTEDAGNTLDRKDNVEDAIKEFVRMFEVVTGNEFHSLEEEKKTQNDQMFFPLPNAKYRNQFETANFIHAMRQDLNVGKPLVVTDTIRESIQGVKADKSVDGLKEFRNDYAKENEGSALILYSRDEGFEEKDKKEHRQEEVEAIVKNIKEFSVQKAQENSLSQVYILEFDDARGSLNNHTALFEVEQKKNEVKVDCTAKEEILVDCIAKEEILVDCIAKEEILAPTHHQLETSPISPQEQLSGINLLEVFSLVLKSQRRTKFQEPTRFEEQNQGLHFVDVSWELQPANEQNMFVIIPEAAEEARVDEVNWVGMKRIEISYQVECNKWPYPAPEEFLSYLTALLIHYSQEVDVMVEQKDRIGIG